MKITTASLIALSLSVIALTGTGSAAVTIIEGSTASFSFDLSDVSPHSTAGLPNTRVGFFFIGLLPSEAFELRVFDEAGDLDPTFLATYTGGTGNSFYDFSPGVSDLDGTFSITMTAGEATLDEYFVSITSPSGGLYSTKYPNVVPEPGSLFLGLLGTSILAKRNRRTSRLFDSVHEGTAG